MRTSTISCACWIAVSRGQRTPHRGMCRRQARPPLLPPSSRITWMDNRRRRSTAPTMIPSTRTITIYITTASWAPMRWSLSSADMMSRKVRSHWLILILYFSTNQNRSAANRSNLLFAPFDCLLKYFSINFGKSQRLIHLLFFVLICIPRKTSNQKPMGYNYEWVCVVKTTHYFRD